jgi:hypothetical protein
MAMTWGDRVEAVGTHWHNSNVAGRNRAAESCELRGFIVFDWLIVSLIFYIFAGIGGLRSAYQGAAACGRLGSPSTQGALVRSGKIQREGV